MEDFDGENLDTLTPLTKRFDYLCKRIKNLTHTQQSKRIPMSENLPNKAVFQSYMDMCQIRFQSLRKRIIYRLIEFAQRWLEGIKIKDHMHKIEPSDCGVNITMPVASILRETMTTTMPRLKLHSHRYLRKGLNMKMIRFGSIQPSSNTLK